MYERAEWGFNLLCQINALENWYLFKTLWNHLRGHERLYDIEAVEICSKQSNPQQNQHTCTFKQFATININRFTMISTWAQIFNPFHIVEAHDFCLDIWFWENIYRTYNIIKMMHPIKLLHCIDFRLNKLLNINGP